MLIAADLGSTNFKAALFDAGGARLAEAARPLPYTVHTNERAELDPGQVRETFLALLGDTVRKAGLRIGRVTRLAMTSQAQTFLLATPEGVPKSPFYGWSDDRAQAEAAQLKEALAGDCHRQTGWPEPAERHMTAKVLWLKNRDSLGERDRIVSLPAYLGMILGAEHGNDANLAAMSGFHSIPREDWWPEALSATGVTDAQLGGIVPPGAALPRNKTGPPPAFDPGLEIFPAGNDHTAGAYGCDCGPARSLLTLGTAGVLYRHAGARPGPYSPTGLWGPYPSGGYYELQVLSHACSAVDWADSFLFGAVDSRRFVNRAAEVRITDATPFFNPMAWGDENAWTGGGGTDAEKAYAALEGVLFALRALGGEDFFAAESEVVILGGGGRLDYWVQLAADCFNRPIRRAHGDGLDGAARIAGIPAAKAGIGNEDGERFDPDPAGTAKLDERYRRWCAAHADESA